MSDTASRGPSSTRRALLGGTALAAVVAVADTVRPSPTQASTGDPIIAGTLNVAGRSTSLFNNGPAGTDGTALFVNAATHGGRALVAHSSGTQPAVEATAFGAANAVFGATNTSSASGVFGTNQSGNGVYGQSESPGASGVYGENTNGGFGVAGRCNQANGKGVFGEALGAGGTALRGRSGTAGIALKVEGKAVFSRSGTVQVPEKLRRVVVTLSGVTPASIVLATLQQHVNDYVLESAVPGAGSFVLWLNNPAPSGGLSVGWIVFD